MLVYLCANDDVRHEASESEITRDFWYTTSFIRNVNGQGEKKKHYTLDIRPLLHWCEQNDRRLSLPALVFNFSFSFSNGVLLRRIFYVYFCFNLPIFILVRTPTSSCFRRPPSSTGNKIFCAVNTHMAIYAISLLSVIRRTRFSQLCIHLLPMRVYLQTATSSELHKFIAIMIIISLTRNEKNVELPKVNFRLEFFSQFFQSCFPK